MSWSIGDLPSHSERIWYLVGDQAHEGPFSFQELEQRHRRSAPPEELRVWARGWPAALSFQELQRAYLDAQEPEDVPPPFEAPSPPPPELPETAPLVSVSTPTRRQRLGARFWLLLIPIVLLAALGLWPDSDDAQASRPVALGLEQSREIDELARQLAAPQLVPRLGVSRDYAQLFVRDLVQQRCDYEIAGTSAESDNLRGKPVEFETSGQGSSGWVAFKRFSFSQGEKLIPGVYQVKLRRRGCQHQGLRWPGQKAVADEAFVFRSVVFAGESVELELALRELARQHERAQRRTLARTRRAWREVEEKFRTLAALSQQAEAFFGELLVQQYPWPQRLARAVERYTHQFGRALTDFVHQSEQDFAQLALAELHDKVELVGQQGPITAAAQAIAKHCMEQLEALSQLKGAPTRTALAERVKRLTRKLEAERRSLVDAAERARARGAPVRGGEAPAPHQRIESAP